MKLWISKVCSNCHFSKSFIYLLGTEELSDCAMICLCRGQISPHQFYCRTEQTLRGIGKLIWGFGQIHLYFSLLYLLNVILYYDIKEAWHKNHNRSEPRTLTLLRVLKFWKTVNDLHLVSLKKKEVPRSPGSPGRQVIFRGTAVERSRTSAGNIGTPHGKKYSIRKPETKTKTLQTSESEGPLWPPRLIT